MSADESHDSPARDMDSFTNTQLNGETETSFSRAIEEHLSLKKRNASLSGSMPIERYEVVDPMDNHPLFKSEEQARLEETLELQPEVANGQEPVAQVEETAPVARDNGSALPWPGQDDAEGPALDELWGKSRDFDWGE
ncbi:MAG: hypothetical protein U0R50_00360 [Gaiellales bacterium]